MRLARSPCCATTRRSTSASHAIFERRHDGGNSATRHGADANAMRQIGASTFYGRSIAAARAIVDARTAMDAAAEAAAAAAAAELWDRYKLAPEGLRAAGALDWPRRVDEEGLTLIDPFAGG